MGRTTRKYGAAELRRAQRTPAAQRTIIHVRRAGQPDLAVRVTVRDLSGNGIGFVCAQKLAAGDQFYLEPMRNLPGSTRLLYAVAHCRPAGKVSFIIGAELLGVEPAPADTIHIPVPSAAHPA